MRWVRRIAGGVIVVPVDHVPPGFDPAAHGLAVHYGSHPVPDQASLDAGAAVVDFVTRLPTDAQVLFLVSGGASSLVDWLHPGVSLDDLQALNRWALQSGASIAQVNAARRRISRLKGGGLARLAQGRRLQALMISDVPGDDPRIIGSGLLHASADAPGDVVPDAAGSQSSAVRLRFSVRRACWPRAARAQGLQVQGQCVPASKGTPLNSASATLRRSRDSPQASCRSAGANRRCACRNSPVAVAATSTWRSRRRSNSSDAGCTTRACSPWAPTASTARRAMQAHSSTPRRASADAMRVAIRHVSLARANSGTFLEAAGDLLHTGPTLTNVGDLVLGLRLGGHR